MILTNVPMSHPVFADSRWNDAAWQHTAVMALFGNLDDGNARANAQVLFRVEPDVPAPDGTVGRVLVQSIVPPAAEQVRTTDLAPVLAAYQPGQTVRLLLRANTVRTINRTGPDGNVRRHRARVPDSQLPDWLADRLDGATTMHDPVLTEPGELRRGRAQLITTTFRADATINDPDLLARHVRDGIGRAKAYGCGMLSALPIQ